MCGILHTFLTGSLRFWKYTKIVLLNTSFLKKKLIMEIGSITAYLCMDKLKHTMTYWCAFAQNVNKGVLYMDFQIEELYLTRTQS